MKRYFAAIAMSVAPLTVSGASAQQREIWKSFILSMWKAARQRFLLRRPASCCCSTLAIPAMGIVTPSASSPRHNAPDSGASTMS